MARLRTPRFGLRAPEERDWLGGLDERRGQGEHAFAITTLPDGELLGVVTVRLREGGAVGYWLHPDARGQGAMAEALRHVVAWAVQEHGVSGLMLTAHPDNRASQRVAEQAGFVRTGMVVHDPPFRDGCTDAIRFALPV